jgi:hypothetical protein
MALGVQIAPRQYAGHKLVLAMVRQCWARHATREYLQILLAVRRCETASAAVRARRSYAQVSCAALLLICKIRRAMAQEHYTISRTLHHLVLATSISSACASMQIQLKAAALLQAYAKTVARRVLIARRREETRARHAILAHAHAPRMCAREAHSKKKACALLL